MSQSVTLNSCLTLYSTSGLVHYYHLDKSISSYRDFLLVFSFFTAFSIEILKKTVDPNHSVASQLGLHCLRKTPKMGIWS